MATTNDDGASTTAIPLTTMIRDGAGDSSTSSSPASLPDWKRELIERRKNLGKDKPTTIAAAGGVTSGHSHSQHSKQQQPQPPTLLRTPATPDLNRSHTATPVTGTTTPQHNSSKLDFSLGTGFDQVTSPTVAATKSTTVNRCSPRSVAQENSPNSPANPQCRPSTTTTTPTEGYVQLPTTSPILGKSSRSSSSNNNNNNNNSSSSPQVKNENHHNNNCAADNNNQKRNTDDAAAEYEQSVRSSSSASSSAIQSVSGGGRVLRKPDLHHTLGGPSGISASGQRLSSSNHINNNSSSSLNHKMVAQEVCDSAAMDAAALTICGSPQLAGRTDEEAAEELKYGPGIVQKLRSRFMSYTMRLNAAKNQRPSLQNMRRATSLNNLLDDDEDSTRTASPVSQSQTGGGHTRMSAMNGQAEGKGQVEKDLIRYRHSMGATNGFCGGDRAVSLSGGDPGQCDGLKKYQNEMLRSRQLRRGNDSLKRARSVETLRYDSKAWERDIQMTTNNDTLMEVILNEQPLQRSPPTKDVNIEERIVKARERGDPRPMRLKSFMDDTERPPPDLVKTTLMKFEATANRRGRAPTSRNGEVAAKVATYKSILEKPAILYPKPPLSPKKPIIKPRTALHNKTASSARSPSPLLIHVDMTYKQSTPLCPDRRNGSNLSPQTPPDLLINSIGARGKSGSQLMQQQHQQQNGGYESPITQLANKLKSMHLQSPAVVVGGGVVKTADNGGGGNEAAAATAAAIEVGSASSNSSASTATSSATSSPVPPHSGSGSGSVTGSYYLNGGSSAGGRLELGDVSAADCYEYRDYDEDHDPDDDAEEEGDVDVDGRDQLESQVDEEEKQESNKQEDDDNAEEDEQDDEIEVVTRRINKADLQNIGQAGTTQEFRFGTVASNNKSSHLPVVPPRTGAKLKQQQQQQSTAEKMRFVPSGLGGGVVAKAAPPRGNGHSLGVQEIVLVNEGGGGGADGETDVDDCKTTTALLIKQIKEEAARKFCGSGLRDNNNQVAVVVNSSSSSASGGVVNSSSSGLKGNSCSSSSNGNSLNSNGHNHSNNNSSSSVKSGVRGNGNSDTRQALTNREIEKNLINVGKSSEQAKEQQGTPPTAAAVVAKKKSWQEEPQTNTMVFNFSQRKDVPDYIDSDGMILLPNRKRELPKPGESGFVVLGDISLETSTDPDDAWTMGPPSPCNIVFENDNVIIEGKSNLRKQLNRSKWNIRFDDSLTSTFEYVSESSYLEAYDDDYVDSSSDSQISSRSSNGGFFSDGGGSQVSHAAGPKFMTISSAPLGSYMTKGSLASSFELGVTKSPSPGSSVSMSPSPTQSSKEEHAKGGDVLVNGNGSGSGSGDPKSLHLTPATDDQTVAWSEGTRATDLLF